MIVVGWIMPEARRGFTRPVWLVSIAYAATVLLFVLANKLTTSANTIFLQSAAPLYILLLGPVLLHETNRPYDWGIIALQALGLSLFFIGAESPLRTAPNPFVGNLLAAVAGLTWASTVMGLRWVGRAGGSSGSAPAVVLLGNAIAFLVGLPFALPVVEARFVDLVILFGLGAFQIGLAYVFLTRAMRHVPALDASVLLLLEPALNPIWAWLIHGERPGAWSNAGGLLILGATGLKTWLDSRSSPTIHLRTAPPAP